MSLREAVIATARVINPEIGDAAMIATMEWGYWVGSTYVSSKQVEETTHRDKKTAAKQRQS